MGSKFLGVIPRGLPSDTIKIKIRPVVEKLLEFWFFGDILQGPLWDPHKKDKENWPKNKRVESYICPKTKRPKIKRQNKDHLHRAHFDLFCLFDNKFNDFLSFIRFFSMYSTFLTILCKKYHVKVTEMLPLKWSESPRRALN